MDVAATLSELSEWTLSSIGQFTFHGSHMPHILYTSSMFKGVNHVHNLCTYIFYLKKQGCA